MKIKKGFLLMLIVVCVAAVLYAMTHFNLKEERDADRLSDISMRKTEDQTIETSESMDTESIETEQETEVSQAALLQSEYQRILSLPAGNVAATGMLSGELTDRLFFAETIDDTLLARINGYSYTPNDSVSAGDLSYLRMLYYNSDGNTYVGEMIVNQRIADTVLEIFKKLYENQYPIEKMVLIDTYKAEDEASMSDNNTSAFNYRPVAGSSKLSKHSYGLAIDLNPKYNPCVKTASDGTTICQPENGRSYIDRSLAFAYKIDENDLAYQLFTEAGFTWGGHWNSLKDYQHFEYDVE